MGSAGHTSLETILTDLDKFSWLPSAVDQVSACPPKSDFLQGAEINDGSERNCLHLQSEKESGLVKGKQSDGHLDGCRRNTRQTM